MATLAGYNKRIKLTIDHTKVDSTLPFFPVAVHLTSSQGQGVFSELERYGNRSKVAFTAADGASQFYGEVEKFDYANSIALYHVSKTGWSISASADTVFYMYYNRNSADNSTYVGDAGSTPGESVWNSGYKMVQHMNQNPSTTNAIDSTSNDNDGTPNGSMTTGDLIAGLDSALAIDLDGTDDFFHVGSTGIIHGLTNLSIEAIFNCRSATDNAFIWSEALSTGEIIMLRINDNNKIELALNDGTNWHTSISTNSVGTTLKEYFAGVLNSSSGMKTYIGYMNDGTNANTNRAEWGFQAMCASPRAYPRGALTFSLPPPAPVGRSTPNHRTRTNTRNHLVQHELWQFDSSGHLPPLSSGEPFLEVPGAVRRPWDKS